MKANHKKTLGIVGGMGPMATVDLYRKIIELTDAASDQEHIHILIDNNAGVPDRTNAILYGGASPLPMLTESCRRLEAAGAELLVIACNTSHFYYDQLQAAVSIPIINMIEQTVEAIKRQGYRSAIVLGTDGSRQTGIYKKAFEKEGMQAIYPPEPFQSQISALIYHGVKAGVAHWDVSALNAGLAELEEQFQTVSVLACTELPIAVQQYGLKGAFIDPTTVLAKAAISQAGYTVLE